MCTMAFSDPLLLSILTSSVSRQKSLHRPGRSQFHIVKGNDGPGIWKHEYILEGGSCRKLMDECAEHIPGDVELAGAIGVGQPMRRPLCLGLCGRHQGAQDSLGTTRWQTNPSFPSQAPTGGQGRNDTSQLQRQRPVRGH